MDFGEALDEMRKGHKVERIGWNGRNMYVMLADEGTARIHPGGGPPKTVALGPMIVIKTATDEYSPWDGSRTDLLALDWARVK